MHLAQQSKLFIQANINISSLSSVRDQVIETNMQVLQRFVVGSAFTRFRLPLSLKVQHSPVMSVFSNASHSSTSIADKLTKITTWYPYAAYIKFQFAVWEDFKNCKGKIQYYFYGRRFGHGGVCFRFQDSDTPAKAELIIDKFQDKWFIHVKTTEWRPRSENEVEVSKYDWHIGAMLHEAHRFSRDVFEDYHILFNNCKHWKKEVVRYMREKGPQNDNDLSHLDDIIRQLFKEKAVLDIVH